MPSQITVQASNNSAPGVGSQGTASPAKTQRITALDFTKGALVLIMVLYHWINYFIGPDWGYYRYLRFLTPSFIFVTGFMISNVYLAKYDPSDPRLPKRLFTRGFKLLIIFIALNLARLLIVPLVGTGVVSGSLLDVRNIYTIFVSGNFQVVGGKLVSFSILVPISYLLMLSGALMLPYRLYRRTFHVLCVLLLVSSLALEFTGLESANLELITIGMLGVLAGFRPISKVDDFVRHPYLLGLAYLGYLVAITIWNVPFWLQLIGVPLSLMVVYLAGISGGCSGVVGNEFILLGKYSLFGYISQIAILQILAASLRHVELGLFVLILSFVAAFALTIISVEIVDRLRAKAPSMDRAYKAVFA
jgi:peptidoglycan/LPS O-acetylase OafA/YrhL